MLSPADARPLPETLDAIAAADLITLGPGSLYTSLITNLLVRGIPEAIAASRATRVYICNLMTQANESLGLTAAQHIEKILDHARACGLRKDERSSTTPSSTPPPSAPPPSPSTRARASPPSSPTSTASAPSASSPSPATSSTRATSSATPSTPSPKPSSTSRCEKKPLPVSSPVHLRLESQSRVPDRLFPLRHPCATLYLWTHPYSKAPASVWNP